MYTDSDRFLIVKQDQCDRRLTPYNYTSCIVYRLYLTVLTAIGEKKNYNFTL